MTEMELTSLALPELLSKNRQIFVDNTETDTLSEGIKSALNIQLIDRMSSRSACYNSKKYGR